MSLVSVSEVANEVFFALGLTAVALSAAGLA